MLEKFPQNVSVPICNLLKQWGLFLLVWLWVPLSAWGHNIPKGEYDRNVTIEWTKTTVEIRYRVEVDQLTLIRDIDVPDSGFAIDRTKPVTRQQFADAYTNRMREVIPDQLQVQLNGQALTLRCEKVIASFPDAAQFHFILKAPWKPKSDQNTFELEDLNFETKKGTLKLTLAAPKDFTITELVEPPESKTNGRDDPKKRTISAVFAPDKMVVQAPPLPTPKDTNPSKGDLSKGENPAPVVVPQVPLAKGDATPEANKSPEPAPVPQGFFERVGRFLDRMSKDDLPALLENQEGFWLLMLIAFLHGAMHSVSPGHGKTMVAAYLVGERGTAKHALVLGLVVTLTHTSAAILVAVLLNTVLRDVPAKAVERGLNLIGGLVITLVGFWLLMQRIAGKSDHYHFGDHSHSHSHSHSHAEGAEHGHSHGVPADLNGRGGWIRVILLGIAGGLIPCWGAILWVLMCLTAGRFSLALPTVLAFSMGLALVLVLLGLSVVYGQRVGASHWGQKKFFIRWLPILSAAGVLLIGFWFCSRAIRG